MVETRVRKRCPAAVPLAEEMVAVLKAMTGPRPVETEAWYEEACWARAAFIAGMTDLPELPEVIAAMRAGPLVPDEPGSMWGRRVALDAAPVRVIYLLEVAALLRLKRHPVPLSRKASRVSRAAFARWAERVRWTEGMFYSLGGCEAYLKEAVAAR
jgi:hypothetical protein